MTERPSDLEPPAPRDPQPPAVQPETETLPEPLAEASAEMAQAEQRLRSEEIVVAAPMSFHGSAARIWNLTRMEVARRNPWAKIGLGTLAVVLIALAWVLVLGWYVIFGLLLVPYRLIRRGQRKRKVDEARHRELLEHEPPR